MDSDENIVSNKSFKNIPPEIKVPEQDDKSTDTVQSEQYEMPSINNPNAISIFVQDTQPIELHQKTEEEFIKILRSIQGLTDIQIRIIEVRYLSILRKYRERVRIVNVIYHFIRLFVSLGGVAIPALLSIQTPNSQSSVQLFWFTWFISLSVTILHNISNIFRFDKKYFGINSTIDKLSSEGWQYLELSGKYTSHHPHPPATHANQYQLFVNTIEKIKGKQSESEFNFSMETDNKEKSSGPHPGVEQPNTTIVPVQKSPL